MPPEINPQPDPIPNNSRPVIDAAIELLESRRAPGLKTYGTLLQAGNGRDFGRDADEELADWLIYWTGYRIEHGNRIRRLLAMIGERQAAIEKAVKALEPLIRFGYEAAELPTCEECRTALAVYDELKTLST